MTTFQRAARVSDSESVELRPDAISRFLPVEDHLGIDDRWQVYERVTLLSDERRRRRRFRRAR